MPARTNFDNYF